MFVFLLKLYLSSKLGRALWCTPPRATLGVNESLFITEQAELLTTFIVLCRCHVPPGPHLQWTRLPSSKTAPSHGPSTSSPSSTPPPPAVLLAQTHFPSSVFFYDPQLACTGSFPGNPPWLVLGKSPALKFFKLLLTPPSAPPPP